MHDFRKLLVPEGEAVPRPLKSVSDRLILDFTPELTGPNVLVLLTQGTTLASALRDARPDLAFTFFTAEHFFWRTLNEFHGPESNPDGATDARITLHCSANLPEQTFDEILFPTLSGNSSELAQEYLQSAHQRFRSGGRLFVSVNNPKDRWIQAQLKTMYSSTIVRKHKLGLSCIATKTVNLKRVRGFRARFAFRQGERLLFCESRPGVFCHRRVDGGARALIRSLGLLKPPVTTEAQGGSISPTPPPSVRPKPNYSADQNVSNEAASFVPARIIEMGCGSGAVSMAAAVEFPQARILAVDSDARAIECTNASASLNAITNVETLLSSEGAIPEPRSWDLLLGNPPYYSDYRISELFLQTAKAALRSGGRIHIVTKLLDWHEARMKQLFTNVTANAIGEYTVFVAFQK